MCTQAGAARNGAPGGAVARVPCRPRDNARRAPAARGALLHPGATLITQPTTWEAATRRAWSRATAGVHARRASAESGRAPHRARVFPSHPLDPRHHGRPPSRRGRRRTGPVDRAGALGGGGAAVGRPDARGLAPTPALLPTFQARFQAVRAAPSPAATVAARQAPPAPPPPALAAGGLAAPLATPPPLVGPAITLVGDVVERAPTAPRDVPRPAAGFPKAGHRRESKVCGGSGGKGAMARADPSRATALTCSPLGTVFARAPPRRRPRRPAPTNPSATRVL